MTRALVFLTLWMGHSLAAGSTLQAQHQPDNTATLAAMSKLQFLHGDWAGDGWTILPDGRRETFLVHERIQPKLGGLVLLLEGRGVSDDAQQTPGHDALAVVYWDPASSSYKMNAHTAQRGHVAAAATVSDNTLIWSFEPMPGMTVRFTSKVNEKGQWVETGEMIRTGQPARQFLEMTLERVSGGGL